MEKKLEGKKYVALVRCSSTAQIDTSIDAQSALVDAFAREHGMVCVGTVELPGVTGSVPGIRTDIDQLIQRKKDQNDFEVVLLQDATRFTRSGPAHGMKMLYDLRSAGLQVVFAKDDLPEGDLGDVMRGLQFFAGKEQVRSIAHACARGASFSLKEGRSAHCKAPPYGVDRLYTTDDGTPKHIIRNLPDGTQHKLDARTGAVLETFGRNEKSGVPAHYIKQKNERIVLVPGNPVHVKVVQQIFERHHRDGRGYRRIAQELNDDAVPSPRGGLWYNNSVRSILLNPVYLGTGLANIFSSAIYYMRGHNGPVESAIDLAHGGAGRPPRRSRLKAEWVKRAEPHLADMLDEALKPAATQKQQARLDAVATQQPQPFNRDRHRDSGFILKGILVARQGGYPMTGRRTGKPSCKKRYYAVSKAFNAPTKDKTLRKLIPADPLEAAILAALQLLLSESSHMRQRIEKIARQEIRAEHSRGGNLDDLRTEQTKIERQLNLIIDEFDDVGRDAVSRKVKSLQVRLKQIHDEIRQRITSKKAEGDPVEIADAICKRLAALEQEIPALPPAALRSVLRQFIPKLVIDLESKDIEVEFAIPSWSSMDLATVCLDDKLAYKTDIEAQPNLLIHRLLMGHRSAYWSCDFAA